jgi:hypothetical protein
MATRSTIALEFADGTIGQVYAHWDGYLAHNGKILFENYSNPFVLRDLIDLGSLSSLQSTIGTKHPFSHYDVPGMTIVEYGNLYRDMTTFYGRDRGEGQSDATYFKDFEDFKANGQQEEYDYILRNVNGVATWFVSDHGSEYMLLTEAFAKEARELAEESKEELPL